MTVTNILALHAHRTWIHTTHCSELSLKHQTTGWMNYRAKIHQKNTQINIPITKQWEHQNAASYTPQKKRETKLKREHLNRSNCHITACTTCKNFYLHNFYRNGSYKHLTHCTNGRFKDRNELGFRIYKQINCIRENKIPYKNLNKKNEPQILQPFSLFEKVLSSQFL